MNESRDLFDSRWAEDLFRNADGAPLLAPPAVLNQGSSVRLVDLRPREEAEGVLGHIPGSVFADPAHAPTDLPLVLIDSDGTTSAEVALGMEREGAVRVAAMAGGIAAWREHGFTTIREPARMAGPTAPPLERRETLSRHEVEAHIGDPSSVRWVKLVSLAALQNCSCVDGRDEREVIGTPGGDSGEFLLGLAALEQVTGKAFDEETVERALLAYLDTFGDFYLHSDGNAMETFLKEAQAHPRLAPAVSGLASGSDFCAFLTNPDPGARDALLEQLVDPAHIGCGHIRLMMQHGDEYRIRPELVAAFLRSFFRLWWAGAPELTFTVLPGGHEEAAVINVRLDEEPWILSRIPLVSPSCAGWQMFVNHPDVTSYMRALNVEHLARRPGPVGIERSRAPELRAAIDELAGRQLTTTLGYLAKGLPIFDVVFGRDGSFEVREP